MSILISLKGEVFHAAGVGVAGAVVVEDDVEAHFLEALDLLFSVRIEDAVFCDFKADGIGRDVAGVPDFFKVVGEVEAEALAGGDVELDPAHTAAGEAAGSDEFACFGEDLVAQGIDDAYGFGKSDEFVGRDDAVFVPEACEGFGAMEFSCLGFNQGLEEHFDGSALNGFLQDITDMQLSDGALLVFLVDEDVFVLEGVEITEGEFQDFPEFSRAGVMDAAVHKTAADVEGRGLFFTRPGAFELLMDPGCGGG